jgi:tripartite-type tricarboxylate transporter receptor subunit TctC
MVFISVSNAIPAMQTGRIKILAVLEPSRYAKLPQVRSMSEVVPAFQKPSSWFGFLAPAGLPREILTRLNAEIVTALDAPDVRGKLEDNGMTVIGGTPEQFGALMQDGIVRYGAIVKAAGIPAE